MRQRLVKVTENGRRQSPIDLNRSYWGRKWDSFLYWTALIIRWSIIILVIALAVRVFFPKIQRYEVPKEVFIDNLSGKISDLKNELMADLREGENGAVVVYDPPKGKYSCKEDFASFGKYQFKICTVIGYYKKLYGKEINKKEAVLIALDDLKSEELARDIIFKENGGINNWYNTANKYDLRDKLAVIKNLEK